MVHNQLKWNKHDLTRKRKVDPEPYNGCRPGRKGLQLRLTVAGLCPARGVIGHRLHTGALGGALAAYPTGAQVRMFTSTHRSG